MMCRRETLRGVTWGRGLKWLFFGATYLLKVPLPHVFKGEEQIKVNCLLISI